MGIQMKDDVRVDVRTSTLSRRAKPSRTARGRSAALAGAALAGAALLTAALAAFSAAPADVQVAASDTGAVGIFDQDCCNH